jgi:hypothetical protein
MKTHSRGGFRRTTFSSPIGNEDVAIRRGGHMEYRTSTLHPVCLEGNTQCLVMFGRSFGSRYTTFVHKQGIITTTSVHSRSCASAFPLRPSPTYSQRTHKISNTRVGLTLFVLSYQIVEFCIIHGGKWAVNTIKLQV